MWKWSQYVDPGVLQNQIEEYLVLHEARTVYEKELENLITEGGLLPYEKDEHRSVKGLIHFMAVIQRNIAKCSQCWILENLILKSKYSRPTLMCVQTIWESRSQGLNVSMTDFEEKKYTSKFEYTTLYGHTKQW